MKLTTLRIVVSLAAVLLGALGLDAQTNTPYSYPYSALYVDASQFCANGFNSVLHGCNPSSGGTGASTGMWEAIAAAVASPFNTSNIVDARAFQGNQLVTYGVGTTALYGCLTTATCPPNTVGSQVNGTLLLASGVTNYCDGPSSGPTGYYTDGHSNYGTPCIIVPWGFQVIGSAPLGSTFVPCGTSLPAPCTHTFPQRAFQITAISVSTTSPTMTVTVSGAPFITSGGFGSSQNIYPGGPVTPPAPTDNGELVVIAGAPAGYNFLRTVQTATSTSFVVSVPSSTPSGQICGTPAPACPGSAFAYLITPVIGFGYQGTTSIAYEPVRVGSSQSFGSRLINLTFDLGGGYPGVVGAQNLNGGEQSGMDTIHCIHLSTGCVQVGPGANESGPYNNIYAQTLVPGGAAYTQPATFGIYNGAATAGFHRFTFVAQATSSSNNPTAAIYDDGSNVTFDGEPHNEGTVDSIDVAPDTAVAGVTINGIVGPPTTNSGTNLVHILKSGNTLGNYSVSGSTFTALTQQSTGSTNSLQDDLNTNTVSDPFLLRYELDNSGNVVSGATSQSNSSVTTLNGSNIITRGGLTSGGPASGTNGSLTLNGSISGSAAITVSSTGTLALPSGTTATNMVLTTPNLGTPSAAILTNASQLPLGSGLTATFSPPLNLSVNTLSCPTCVTSGSALTNTAIMTGAGGAQGSQTPSASATLSSGGNMSLPGSMTVAGHLNQNATNFAGSCTMSTTSCTFTITASFTSTPLTFASQDGSATLVNTAAKCSVSGTTVTITAVANNTNKWDCLIIGNPN